jgi:hypothetical protein
MSHLHSYAVRLLICATLVLGTIACQQAQPAPVAAPTAESTPDKDLEALKADVQILKDKAASASVAMADVSFHWLNLWFAGQAKNWPLASYYFSEARNHVRWLIRITPMPNGPDGQPVDLKGIFDAIDTGTFADVKDAIDKKDSARFATTYRAALESCYQCHKSVGRPYLRPQIPTTIPQTIVNFDPAAKWPE